MWVRPAGGTFPVIEHEAGSVNCTDGGGGGWRCTREPGHVGRHLAGVGNNAVAAAWPGEHEPTEADLSDEVAPMSDVRLIFKTNDTAGDEVIIETRCGKPDELFVWGDATYLTRQQVTEMRTALGEWLASTAPEPEAPEPIVPELIPAVTHIHGRIDRLAARVNQLEADAAKPSPLHQAIADEIRRAAGIS